MAEDDKGKRLERALEEGRDWLERSAEDVVKRLGHAGRHARAFGDGGSAESKAPADLFEESELDADELFSRERQRELEELGHANILSVRALERE